MASLGSAIASPFPQAFCLWELKEGQRQEEERKGACYLLGGLVSVTEGILRGGRTPLSEAAARVKTECRRTSAASRRKSSMGYLHSEVAIPKPHTLHWVQKWCGSGTQKPGPNCSAFSIFPWGHSDHPLCNPESLPVSDAFPLGTVSVPDLGLTSWVNAFLCQCVWE